MQSNSDFIAHVDFRIPLFPKVRTWRAQYGIYEVEAFRFAYRYDSGGISHTPKNTIPAFEPEVGVSFRDFTELARPIHFMNKAR